MEHWTDDDDILRVWGQDQMQQLPGDRNELLDHLVQHGAAQRFPMESGRALGRENSVPWRPAHRIGKKKKLTKKQKQKFEASAERVKQMRGGKRKTKRRKRRKNKKTKRKRY